MTFGSDWRSLGTIRDPFRPYGNVLWRHIAEGCSGNPVLTPGFVVAAQCTLSISGIRTAFLERTYNMLLRDDLLRIRGLRLHLMHYGRDIRANYAVCVGGESVVAG